FRYAEDHGWATNIPKHFWCLIGDSELREGSLMEAMPDVAERELGNVTWIIDYNRQNLDGTRIPNQRGLQGTDADRIERMFAANGWEVIQLRHGSIRDQVFQTKGGDLYRAVLEESYSDYEYQALLWKQDGILIREDLLQREPKLKEFLNQVSDEDLVASFGDLGGHDMTKVLAAYEHARKDERVPVLIVAHTVKGWGLNCAAMPGNHSSLPSQEEVEALLTAEGIDPTSPYTFGDWESDGPERNWLTEKGTHWRLGIEQVEEKVEENRQRATQRMGDSLPLPTDFGIDLKLVPLAHTQWVWGQVAGKLIRVGTHDELEAAGQEAGRELTDFETQWAKVADLMVTMSPDVGTSTNINPAMDAKIYGPSCGINLEAELDLNERGRPELFQHQDPWTRHIRFEIAEANCMSAAGSFGKMGKFSGVPLLPMMTVYDFFIKRALDQLYYNVYWRSSFILIGTPSGVSLSPEGAQHSWKSDIQMPSLVTWEPSYAAEMEWILADAVDRHVRQDNEDREGVLIRAVTRGISQKEFTKRTKALPRFQDCDEATRLESLRQDVLHGGYKLVDKSQDSDYEPGENVVDLLVMGALAPEALEASDQLAEQGIQANVIVVTSADLL
ncbi:MAG: pyruvate dehydrogenase, partial [Planctomycetes bacterium]|nr:pyruvate dehydrogenase [Planctomycetota bacterium]